MDYIVYPSKNYSIRNKLDEIKFVIIHYTESNKENSLRILSGKTDKKVSSHYFIDKQGVIYELVNPKYIAWHAGVSHWGGIDQLNFCSIGVELENLGNEPFDWRQMQSLITLCLRLMYNYKIPYHNFLGHADIAYERKEDPGIFFDWFCLFQKGIGEYITYEEEIHCNLDFTEDNFFNNLKYIGYKFSNNSHDRLVKIFQSHFCPQSYGKGIDKKTIKIAELLKNKINLRR